MTWPLAASLVILALAALPAWMTFRNLGRFRRLPEAPAPPAGPGGLSVLIPARDEAAGIAGCVRAVLAAAGGVEPLEVVVLDDHSTDGTAAAVEALAAEDPRVRLERAPPLPEGWNGKQHACWVLAQRARHRRLAWIDADVRLRPGTLARLVAELDRNPAALVSGFPEQLTTSAGEDLVVPQIAAVLVGYLPMKRMRASTLPGFGAGCGQWFAADRDAYLGCGGHAAIRHSIHDGVALPRTFRRAGHLTDLFDGTGSATCRMYDDFRGTWAGFAKNATEAMATPVAILPWTTLLLGGWVLPWVLAAAWCLGAWPVPAWAALAPAALALATNLAVTRRFHQGVRAFLLRPVGIATLVAIQWYALARKLGGGKATWRGRTY
ncbi:glycosyltransferase family 2 protein [Phycisphaera mikurensis]|uniref:Putative glycosyltransferase n=1 Tax=Phycisphaera mikurensis (strain NBRC 102666 / KCTC 22515 / FYK2301M01) TaxID=1142394 RepID=I0ICE3_PHYMF|nr:glycosyltransferase family A protein [Phycisphaera mikurensis]MBB6442192.1 hypothetical protein [Phycisphaera mikurensis]BAM02931.1 putative glycosyltransferase [Phycisphaera mikurensis NBRC 102666]